MKIPHNINLLESLAMRYETDTHNANSQIVAYLDNLVGVGEHIDFLTPLQAMVEKGEAASSRYLYVKNLIAAIKGGDEDHEEEGILSEEEISELLKEAVELENESEEPEVEDDVVVVTPLKEE